MGKTYRFDSETNEIVKYPRRNDYLTDLNNMNGKSIIFHANDATTITSRTIYDQALSKYSIVVTGTLDSGHRANVIITNLPVYFDVHLIDGMKPSFITQYINGVKHMKIIDDHYRGQAFDIDPPKFVRLYFDNMYLRREALKVLRGKSVYELYNDWDDNEWFHYTLVQQDYTISDWVLLTNPKHLNTSDGNVVYVIDIDTNSTGYTSVNKPLSHDPPIVKVPDIDIHFKCAWDIEVLGNTFQLPQVTNIDEPIFMIGGGIYISTQEEPIHEFCITYKDVDYDTNNITWDLIQCSNEKEVLLAFIDILDKFKPEYAMAFNNYQFDNPFVIKRSEQSHVDILDVVVKKMENISTDSIISYRNTAIKHLLSSKNIKMESGRSMDGEIINNIGMNDLDMMVCLMRATYKKDETLVSNALRSYLVKYKLPNKLDMSIEDMKQAYITDDSKAMKEVCDYCVVDGLSCERLQVKASIIISLRSLAHLSFCRVMETITRAGGMKVKNMIWCIAKRLKVLYMANPVKRLYDGKYPGAIVFPPIKGRYLNSPIITKDFKSLYPSVMLGLHISYETYIQDEKIVKKLRKLGYDVFSHTFKLEDKTFTTHFARLDEKGNQVRGVYPNGLKLLADLRNSYKELMKKHANDPLTHRKYDEHQKATKILMNTIYGWIGAESSFIYNVNISTTITSFAREALITARDVAISMNSRLIYGDTDSVMIEPLISFDDLKTPKEKVDRAIEFAKPIQQAINEAMFKKIGSIEAFRSIEINLDKILYPAIFCGKKKYFGDAWENGIPEAYISGMECAKRGKSSLLKVISKDIMDELKDFNYNGTIIACVLKHFDEVINTTQQQPNSFFYKKGRYSEGKAGTANLFIERMKIEAEKHPQLYRVPQPGEYFEYAVTKPIKQYNYNGTVYNTKISDRWEFSSIIEHYNNLSIDYEYYLTDLIGSLARFINSDSKFTITPDTDMDVDIDKKEQEKAKKYLEKYLKNKLQGEQLGSSTVKTHLNYIRSRCMVFGKYTHYINSAYDDGIRSGIIDYILKTVTTPNKASSIEEFNDVSLEDINHLIDIHTKKVMNKRNVLENIYQECITSINEAIVKKDPKYHIIDNERRIRIVKKVLDNLSELSKLHTQRYHLSDNSNTIICNDSPIKKMIMLWLAHK